MISIKLLEIYVAYLKVQFKKYSSFSLYSEIWKYTIVTELHHHKCTIFIFEIVYPTAVCYELLSGALKRNSNSGIPVPLGQPTEIPMLPQYCDITMLR